MQLSRRSNEEFQYARDLYSFIEHVKEAVMVRELNVGPSYRTYEFPQTQLLNSRFSEICTRPTEVICLLFTESDKLEADRKGHYYPGIRYWIDTCPDSNPIGPIERAFKIDGGHVGGFEMIYGLPKSALNIYSFAVLDSPYSPFKDGADALKRLCSERERINRALVEMITNPDEFISGLDIVILNLEQNLPNEKKPLEVSATYKRVVTVDGLETAP